MSQADSMPTVEESSRTASITPFPPARQVGSGDPTMRPLFLNIDDDFSLTQGVFQLQRFPAQLLVFFGDGIPLGLGAAFLGRQRLENNGIALAAPGCQKGGVQAFTT